MYESFVRNYLEKMSPACRDSSLLIFTSILFLEQFSVTASINYNMILLMPHAQGSQTQRFEPLTLHFKAKYHTSSDIKFQDKLHLIIYLYSDKKELETMSFMLNMLAKKHWSESYLPSRHVSPIKGISKCCKHTYNLLFYKLYDLSTPQINFESEVNKVRIMERFPLAKRFPLRMDIIHSCILNWFVSFLIYVYLDRFHGLHSLTAS